MARRHGPALAAILEPRLRLRLDGREATVRLREVEPVPDRQGLRFALEVESTAAPGRLDLETTVFPYDGTHQTFVNVYEGDALRHQAILDARHTTFTYYAGSWQGVGAVLGHLPAGRRVPHRHRPRPPAVPARPAAARRQPGPARGDRHRLHDRPHGDAVAGGAGGLRPPAAIVEPLIALSIVLVGVDNLLVGDGAAASRDLRPWMAGLFGLVHGFGFASVLAEFGLPREALGWSLFGFNLGVEVGQLAFVLPVAALLAAIRGRSPARRRPAGDGRLSRRRAGRRVLVRPTRVLPRE